MRKRAHYQCDRAVVITNARFTKSARDLARSNDCVLIDRASLQHLMDGQTDFVSYCESAANASAG